METFPETIELHDNRQVVLRPMVSADADALHRYFVGLSDLARRYLRDDVRDPVVVKQWAADLDYSRILPVLALDGDNVIGVGTLHFPIRKWQRHLCEFRVTVADDHRRQGLGTALLRALMRIAFSRGLEKCVVRLMASEQTALNVFQHLGFHIESVLKDFAIDAEGNKQDVIVLCNNIDDLWKQIQDAMLDMDIPRR